MANPLPQHPCERALHSHETYRDPDHLGMSTYKTYLCLRLQQSYKPTICSVGQKALLIKHGKHTPVKSEADSHQATAAARWDACL